MRYFVVSDFHFGHFNIIRYTNRPFKSLEEMNETIIKRHNERVKPEDTVLFLGDFCFRSKSGRGEGDGFKAEHYLNQLNGKFIFVKGNHDRNNSLNTHIEKLIFSYAGKNYHFTHSPDNADFRYDVNFVGHVHNLWKFNRIRSGETFTDLINVSCDVWDYYPQTIEELLKKYHYWKKHEFDNLREIKNDN